MSELTTVILNGQEYDIGGVGSGLTDDIKDSLLEIVENVAFINDHGRQYYNALYAALYPYAPVSIDAVLSPSATITDFDTLDDLRQYLTVTAHYQNGTSSVVTNYSLSGVLTAGTSTILVTYAGVSYTVEVTVTHDPLPSAYQEVEYIGFDGNSRIVTNPTLTNDLRIEAKLQINRPSSEEAILVIADSSTVKIDFGTSTTLNRLFLFSNDNSLAVTDIADLYSEPTYLVADYEYNIERKLKVTVNNVDYNNSDQRASTNVSSGYKFVIGSGGYNSQRLSYTGDVYYTNVYCDGEKILHLVPCYRISDDAIGMYDKMNDVFYTNSGSGTFTKGADV